MEDFALLPETASLGLSCSFINARGLSAPQDGQLMTIIGHAFAWKAAFELRVLRAVKVHANMAVFFAPLMPSRLAQETLPRIHNDPVVNAMKVAVVSIGQILCVLSSCALSPSWSASWTGAPLSLKLVCLGPRRQSKVPS